MLNIISSAAGLAAMIMGILSAVTGIKTLSGISTPDYTTHSTLIIYNVVLGIVSIYTGYLIFKKNRLALTFSGK